MGKIPGRGHNVRVRPERIAPAQGPLRLGPYRGDVVYGRRTPSLLSAAQRHSGGGPVSSWTGGMGRLDRRMQTACGGPCPALAMRWTECRWTGSRGLTRSHWSGRRPPSLMCRLGQTARQPVCSRRCTCGILDVWVCGSRAAGTRREYSGGRAGTIPCHWRPQECSSPEHATTGGQAHRPCRTNRKFKDVEHLSAEYNFRACRLVAHPRRRLDPTRPLHTLKIQSLENGGSPPNCGRRPRAIAARYPDWNRQALAPWHGESPD